MNALAENLAGVDLPPTLAAALAPLDGDGAGEDPRHGERFFMLRQEVEKRAEVRMDEVRRLALEILAQEGKDLRAACYLLWPLALGEGAAGLGNALVLLQALIEQYGDGLHPSKPGLRAAALRWLQGNRPRHAIEQAFADKAMDAALLARIRAAVEGIRTAAIEGIAEELDWLLKPLEAAEARCAPAEEPSGSPAAEEENAGESVPKEARPSGPAPATAPAGIESETDFMRQARAMLAWLEEQGEAARALGLRRSLRWSGLTEPPAEQGRTRLPAPRAEARRGLEAAAQQGQHEEVLRLGEGLFMDQGGHLWLELQWLEYEAARALGRQPVAALIAAETAALLQRLPGLAALSFEDGTPFAGPRMQAWLEELQPTSEAASGAGQGQPSEALAALRDEARQKAAEAGLPAALELLQQAPARDAAERLQLRLWMAALCLQQNRADLAAPLLEEPGVEPAELGAWQPGLGFELARLRRQVAQAQAAAAKGAAAEEWRRRAEAAWRDMCRLDAAKAAQAV